LKRRFASALTGLLACCALGAVLAPFAVAETTLQFTEPEKGSTFEFVDVPPYATTKHGIAISPGDELVITNPLTRDGKTIGKLRATCTATAYTKASDSKAITNAHFICQGVYFFGKSTLYASAAIVKGGTEGVITGGTGDYAGARGTFFAKDAKGGSSTTISFID
jgi:hypothetical protein